MKRNISIGAIALLLASCSQAQQNPTVLQTPVQVPVQAPPAASQFNIPNTNNVDTSQVQRMPSGQWVFLNRIPYVTTEPPFSLYFDPIYTYKGQYRYVWTKVISDYLDSVKAKYTYVYEIFDCSNNTMMNYLTVLANVSDVPFFSSNETGFIPANQQLSAIVCK